MALAIGANSAVLSVMQGVLLRPLPYPQPDRLMRIYYQSDSQPKFPLNPNDFRDQACEPRMLHCFGVTAGYFQKANEDLRNILNHLMNEHTGKGWRVYLIPLYHETVGKSQTMLLILFGTVGLLLLIACVNAANLLLVRAGARVREIAVRSAFGAARETHHPPLITESMFIALAAAGDHKPDSASVRPGFWMPHVQQTARWISVAVRASLDAAQRANQFRLTLRQLDPELAAADLRTMEQITAEAFSTRRFSLFLVALFALLALSLATFGIYGGISYATNQRMHEFGIRMALGAKPAHLIRMIVGHGLKLTAAGVTLGMICAAAVGRLLGSLLYGVSATDPAAFAAVALPELVTTTFACYIPPGVQAAPIPSAACISIEPMKKPHPLKEVRLDSLSLVGLLKRGCSIRTRLQRTEQAMLAEARCIGAWRSCKV